MRVDNPGRPAFVVGNRNRLEHDDAFHGRRRDVLRRADTGFEIAKRHIELDTAVPQIEHEHNDDRYSIDHQGQVHLYP
ncbi:aromatic-ring-hydroxylating dioxygenase subunit beta [Rhodococcus sp. T2V]|uniref:aromatic-ring-hydroxylating dioxygenase subunit beta n=1 Tax=Rhodococcus sp. T2V TaxID=3034164 RepID=UPI0023E22EEC|nr:aromatic-ring-hydroxylating dioxygenase subunit beta [Rhodococcus sp. T2V]MDF3313604.1 aromatic-ring-hydroxylating dioxygenase subunit beta [Rhodococcus sp. T2V]